MTRFQARRKLRKACAGALLTGFHVRKKLLKATTIATFLAIGAGTISIGQAQAVVVTFDDIQTTSDGDVIPNGYAGLNWDNFHSLDSSSLASTGYGYGTVSAPNVAFNSEGNPATVSIDNGKYDLNSVHLAAAWNNGLNILVEGFLGEELLYSKTVTVDSTASTQYNLDFLDIDNVRFTSSGGVDAGYGGGGTQFALDNFTYETEPVPEPLTILGSLAAGSFGVALRRKYKQQQKDTAKV
ncbi:PEP-CTERM sorting domain-containing protein [Brasilonema sp. UFV-L1]|uniref:PEP-CTERM sorting domain-containing protein n=1 Tax=Brasilonema sp. UFV-L1 TaxID=2234130 RepID=UPI00145F8F5C|nr:PEP-CTERM sorting domain-containing protein [Brasilonema sp. UFV-L1]NMG09292.1 PEP-CTERM sorting domain-containing protein [Brasilonema sp. UFV-L1]